MASASSRASPRWRAGAWEVDCIFTGETGSVSENNLSQRVPLEKNARNFSPVAGPAESADHQKKKRPDTDVVPRALQLDFKGFKNAYKAEQSGLTGLHAVNAWRESRSSHATHAIGALSYAP